MTDLVIVARTYDRTEAAILRGLLEASGISAVAPEFNFIDTQPYLNFALGGYRVLVNSDDEAEARAILTELHAEAACAPEILEKRTHWVPSLLLSLLAGVPMPVREMRWLARDDEPSA